MSVLNIFQFDSDVGSQAAKKIKPRSIMEMADANGLMRLMTSEKGQESPMEKYIRFKSNINLWYQEMDKYGLTKEEQETLKPYFLKYFKLSFDDLYSNDKRYMQLNEYQESQSIHRNFAITFSFINQWTGKGQRPSEDFSTAREESSYKKMIFPDINFLAL